MGWGKIDEPGPGRGADGPTHEDRGELTTVEGDELTSVHGAGCHPTGVFHVQIRQSMNVSREFNLTEEELRRRILAPWTAGTIVQSGDRKWAPERAKLMVYEGPELRPDEIGMGRGWGNVTKQGTDVTARLLIDSGRAQEATALPPPTSELDQCKQEIVRRAREGGLELGECIALAGSLRFGSRVSERLALAEQAVWELLHAGAIGLDGDGADPRAGAADWQRVLLDWEAWNGAHRVSVTAAD
jgi:hypothetical protein